MSESLDTLDERWKAGAFRYLMPDFRARVHRGETFVIAGDRFAIGSSREMSPAGLKAIAEGKSPEEARREADARTDVVTGGVANDPRPARMIRHTGNAAAGHETGCVE